MRNKLKILAAGLLAASVIGLASCDTVEVKLRQSDAEAPLINAGEGKLPGNTVGDLYDEIVQSGSTNSEKVLNNLLYKLAESYFGKFYGEGGLYETVSGGTQEQKKAYAEAHSTIFGGDVTKLDIFYDKLLESISKSFWSYVKNSSYQKRSVFMEKDFVQAQVKELYVFPDTAAYVERQVFGYNTYRDVEAFFQPDFVEFYKDYIERALLPDAYRKALVEQHLISQNPGALRSSYARKVQIIGLGEIEGFPGATKNLMKQYALQVLARDDEDIEADYPGADLEYIRDFNFLDRLYKGHFNDDEVQLKAIAQAIYTAAEFNVLTVEIDGVQTVIDGVYEQTSYGQLLKDYYRLTSSRWEEGSTTDFTGGSAYTKETGLTIKTNEILAGSKVTEGWYTSSGLSDLSQSIRKRLFNIAVANDVDNEDRTPTYGEYLHHRYYLRQQESDMDESVRYLLDGGSSTLYFVRVDEAVKGPKLTPGGESAYPEAKMKKIEVDVASLIGDGDTYKKAARQYYVRNAAISYHDQYVYDYFKETFPDLFD